MTKRPRKPRHRKYDTPEQREARRERYQAAHAAYVAALVDRWHYGTVIEPEPVRLPGLRSRLYRWKSR